MLRRELHDSDDLREFHECELHRLTERCAECEQLCSIHSQEAQASAEDARVSHEQAQSAAQLSEEQRRRAQVADEERARSLGLLDSAQQERLRLERELSEAQRQLEALQVCALQRTGA